MEQLLFPEYEPIKSQLLIGDFISKLKKKEPKKKQERGITNERQAVLQEIRTEMEKDNPVNIKLLAIRLSHVPTKDLYFILSEARDYRKRGKGEFSKYIWGSIKVKKI